MAAITVVLKRLLNRWAVLRGRGPFQDFTNQHDRAFDGSFDSGARGGCGVAASIVPLVRCSCRLLRTRNRPLAPWY